MVHLQPQKKRKNIECQIRKANLTWARGYRTDGQRDPARQRRGSGRSDEEASDESGHVSWPPCRVCVEAGAGARRAGTVYAPVPPRLIRDCRVTRSKNHTRSYVGQRELGASTV